MSPFSPSQQTPRDGIAFDSSPSSSQLLLTSPRVPGGCVLPSLEEVALHLADYAVYFDDADLLKVSEVSPLRKAPPEGLVKIVGVAADQVNVFYEPKFARKV